MRIKTKLLSCIKSMLLLLAITCLPAKALAYYFEVDGICYSVWSDATVVVYDCTKGGDVIIPSTITYEDKTYTVTRIHSFNNNSITSIWIPSTVDYIDDGIFSSFGSLERINVASENPIYDSRNNCNAVIKTASNTLISGCKSTIIPNTVTTIGSGAFSDCSGLENINIPNSVTTIGWGAFSGCSGLENINIPNSVTTIDFEAFYQCNILRNVDLGNAVTTIGTRAFADCSELASVNIPNSVTEIGFDAFRNTKILENEHGIVYLGNWAVQYNYSEELPADTIIKEGTIGIANGTFGSPDYIQPFTYNVIIPNSVLYIGSDAFSRQIFGGVSPVKHITIGKNVKLIGGGAFYTGSYCWYSGNLAGEVELQSITCLAKVPPMTTGGAFAGMNEFADRHGGWTEIYEDMDYAIYDKVTLYVPSGSVQAYKEADDWCRFKTIIGISVSDIYDVNGDNEITISDINSVIEVIILGSNHPNYNNCDVDGDGEVTIADINAIINAMMGN